MKKYLIKFLEVLVTGLILSAILFGMFKLCQKSHRHCLKQPSENYRDCMGV